MIPYSERPSRFEPALRLAIEGRWNDAVRSVVQGVADPEAEAAHGDEAADALGEIARLAQGGGDSRAADEALIAALLIRPHDSDRLHQRAVVRLALGDGAEARALLERALAVDPNHVSARLELSMLETRDGRLGEALASLHGGQRPVAAVPRGATREFELPASGDPELELERARRDFAEGRLDAAARRVDVLIDRQPARAELHTLRGAIEVRQGALDDAVASCGRALELAPDDAEARTRLAVALEGLGLRDQALTELEHVLAAAPGHEEASALHERWSAGRKRNRAREIPAPKRS